MSDGVVHADSGVAVDAGGGVHEHEQAGTAVATGWIVLSKHRLVYAPSIIEVNPSARRERSVPEAWTDANIKLNNGEYVWITDADIEIVKEALKQ